MALTQTQIIQSLGEALTWFERELSWGVEEAELRHLTGRIGELYAATITFGTMALQTNQRGYDVISDKNERISVKTVTTSNHVTFRETTYDQADRVMILRILVDEEKGVSLELLLDKAASELRPCLKTTANGLVYALSGSTKEAKPLEHIPIIASAGYSDFEIQQYENGTIIVLSNGETQTPAKPVLRAIASEIGFPTHLDSGKEKNTRQIGAGVIQMLNDQAREKRIIEVLGKLKSAE